MNYFYRSDLLFALLLIAFVFSHSVTGATTFFVSPAGKDGNPGTKEKPFATVGKAAEILQPGDTCMVREGIYRETFRPTHSGKEGFEIVFMNYGKERVVLSGADELTGWNKEEHYNKVPMKWSLEDENQVFANGQMMHEATWPALGDNPFFKPNRAVATDGSHTTLRCDEIPGSANDWKGSQLWCAGGKSWICWTASIIDYNPQTHTLTFEEEKNTWYTPEKGNLFVLRGSLFALQDPGEWYYNDKSQELYFIPPANQSLSNLNLEAKRRRHAIDLSDRSYVQINGISVYAAGILMNGKSHHNAFKNITATYVSHSYQRDVSFESGILIDGHDNLVVNCDFGYSSASVLTVKGTDNRIINCNIHHGGYAGLWRGTVSLSGRRIVFSHNTVQHAGRDLVNTHDLMESMVQYNDVSDAGWLTKDLGMFYGHNTDYANTVFRYNHVHDNRAAHLNMGIYFDHLSHNAIVHHNVIWNTGWDPIRINNPSYCNLVFNNTCWNTGKITTFDHADRDDLYACRFFNNVFNASVALPEHVKIYNNLIQRHPPYVDTTARDFRLDTTLMNTGAYDGINEGWKVGYQPHQPPDPLPVYKQPRIEWMNMVYNACFEFGTLEGWKKTGAGQANLVKGNWWGVDFSAGTHEATGTSDFELTLGPGSDGLYQEIKGLTPRTTYTLSAWLKVDNPAEPVVLGVKNHGAEEISVACQSTGWERKSVQFTTGQNKTKATIYLLKPEDGDGVVWCDNLTLPLQPAAK